MPDSRQPQRLTSLQQLLFSLGTFGGAGPTTIIVQLQLYFTKYLGYPATVIANVRGFAIILDAVTDPLMGYISDRTASRFGRRMPYIAVGSVVFAAGLIGMWYAPRGLSVVGFYVYVIGMQALYTIGLTMTSVPYMALIPELVKGYEGRTVLASWMQVGTYVGTTWGGFIRAYTHWRGDEIRGFQEFAVYSALLMVICYGLFVIFIREPPPTSEQWAALKARRRATREFLRRHLSGVARSIGFAFGDSQFLCLFFAVFVYQSGILAGLWLYTFLLEDWFGGTWSGPFAERYLVGPFAPFRDAFFLYIFCAVGCGVLFLPFWNRLGAHLEKKTCLMIGILGIGLTYGASYLLFAPKSYPLLIVYCFLQAFFYCPANIYPASMLADVATHSEWQRGEANEGMFYGANSLLVKLYNAAAIFWTGYALDHIVKYERGEGVAQTAETLHLMRLLYAFPAVLSCLVALFILSRYRLDRARMRRVTDELETRAAAPAGRAASG